VKVGDEPVEAPHDGKGGGRQGVTTAGWRETGRSPTTVPDLKIPQTS
jgi:hypothetical protein